MNTFIESATENIPQQSPKGKPYTEKTSKKSTKKLNFFKKHATTISIPVLVVLAALCLWLLKDIISIGAKALINNYVVAFETEKKAAYDEFYDRAFDKAKKNYHVSNRMVISINSLEKYNKLEVLKANHVEFITEDRDSNLGNVTAWLEVTGEGTFVVDLKAAEFIVDNYRRYVLVRIPYPELTNVIVTNTIKRFFKDDWKNGSYDEGVDLALKQQNEAGVRIHKALMSNQYIYNSAQDVAKNIIENLVKQFNTEIPDLTVEVEFIG